MLTVMQILGSCSYYVLFIFILCKNMSICDSVVHNLPGYFNCFTINDTAIYNATRISYDIGQRLIYGGKPNSTDQMPVAPKDLASKMEDDTPVIRWFTDPRILYGLNYLRHILLEVVQFYEHNGTTFKNTDYILLNVSGKSAKTVFSYNCTQLKPDAYKVNVTLWFLGKLRQSFDGQLSADVDNLSKSRSHVISKHDILPALKAAKLATEQCICGSTIAINISPQKTWNKTFAEVRTLIQAVGLPEDTRVEIQLVKNVSQNEKILLDSSTVLGTDIKNPFVKTFHVRRGRSYYIRVIRHCERRYKGVLSCGKREADVMRTESVLIDTVQLSSSIADQGGIDIYQVLQMAAITFAFSICLVAEVALIFKIFTVVFCYQKKSSRFFKRSTYVKLDNKGQVETKLTMEKRVAVIYTKDSDTHEEMVRRINDMLRERGIDSVLFDEATSLEMRANWIQAAENVVTDFDVVLFILSPCLYNVCKKIETETVCMIKETNEVGVPILTRFPGVVLDTLKVKNVWLDKNKAKVVPICVAETKHDCKQLSIKMRREHPLIFKDIVYFDRQRQVDGSSNRKQIKKVINVIKSSS